MQDRKQGYHMDAVQSIGQTGPVPGELLPEPPYWPTLSNVTIHQLLRLFAAYSHQTTGSQA